MTIFGTRPEAIKMAPLVKAIEEDLRFESIVTVTAQHRQMLDQVMNIFDLSADYDLNIMKDGQTLAGITSRVIKELDQIFEEAKPDIVLVHGDTTTTFSASIASFYHQIKIGHVEAGLRTWNKYSPFPEEMNRQLTDVLADIYFAPTEMSKKNLLNEKRNVSDIYVTGNTAIDAMKYTISDQYSHSLLTDIGDKKIILVTMHRRENLGNPMKNVFKAINRIVEHFDDVHVVFPMHKNPIVRKTVKETLIDCDRIHLIEPLDVVDFQNFANHSYMIMSDSGGVQEDRQGEHGVHLHLHLENKLPGRRSGGACRERGQYKFHKGADGVSDYRLRQAEPAQTRKIFQELRRHKGAYGKTPRHYPAQIRGGSERPGQGDSALGNRKLAQAQRRLLHFL